MGNIIKGFEVSNYDFIQSGKCIRTNLKKTCFLLQYSRNPQTIQVKRVTSNTQELNVQLDHFRCDG